MWGALNTSAQVEDHWMGVARQLDWQLDIGGPKPTFGE
jgi:hypothetical protein